jgi:hypothetical protein
VPGPVRVINSFCSAESVSVRRLMAALRARVELAAEAISAPPSTHESEPIGEQAVRNAVSWHRDKGAPRARRTAPLPRPRAPSCRPNRG